MRKEAPMPRRSGERLPFAGDKTLSIVISKALFLADDDRITDPVIPRQL